MSSSLLGYQLLKPLIAFEAQEACTLWVVERKQAQVPTFCIPSYPHDRGVCRPMPFPMWLNTRAESGTTQTSTPAGDLVVSGKRCKRLISCCCMRLDFGYALPHHTQLQQPYGDGASMTLFSVQPIRADLLLVLCLPHGDKEVVPHAPHDKNIYNRIDRIRRYSHHDQPVNDSEQHGCRPAEPSNALS